MHHIVILLVAPWAAAAPAQHYPNRTVPVILPTPPGGLIEVVGHLNQALWRYTHVDSP